jgi:hypothetical protein
MKTGDFIWNTTYRVVARVTGIQPLNTKLNVVLDADTAD